MSSDGHPRVVLVDDEEMILTSLRAFFELETDYEIATFTDPREAAGFFETERIDLVISDFLMPEMDGVELLAKAKETQPSATRILLTGFADKGNAIKAINIADIFYYVEKPWNNSDLKILVERGLERSSLLRRIVELLGQLKETEGIRADLIKILS